MPLKIEPDGGGVTISVKVVPGASRNRIVGVLGDALKIAVSAPPEGGKANQAVIELLAATLRVQRQSVTVLKGHTSPRKQVAIRGISVDDALKRLNA